MRRATPFGVYLRNPRSLVDRLLKATGYDGTRAVSFRSGTKLLKAAPLSDYELTLLTPVVVCNYAACAGNGRLAGLVTDAVELEDYCRNRDVLDLVSEFEPPAVPEELLGALRNLMPRLYSAASALEADTVARRADLTISLVEYTLSGRVHRGACSTYIADRVEPGSLRFGRFCRSGVGGVRPALTDWSLGTAMNTATFSIQTSLSQCSAMVF